MLPHVPKQEPRINAALPRAVHTIGGAGGTARFRRGEADAASASTGGYQRGPVLLAGHGPLFP
jgi:hypothetical protein